MVSAITGKKWPWVKVDPTCTPSFADCRVVLPSTRYFVSRSGMSRWPWARGVGPFHERAPSIIRQGESVCTVFVFLYILMKGWQTTGGGTGPDWTRCMGNPVHRTRGYAAGLWAYPRPALARRPRPPRADRVPRPAIPASAHARARWPKNHCRRAIPRGRPHQ